MSDSLFIDDGYTATKVIEAVPGLHPAATVVYRPALHARKRAWQHAATVSPEAQAKADVDIVFEHVATINGEKLPKDRLPKLRPALFAKVLDLVLGYAGSDEEKADLGN